MIPKDEYDPYYQDYVVQAQTSNLIEGLTKNHKEVVLFFKQIPTHKLAFKYKASKWNVKEILLHLIDTERIFAYRALRIAREDKTALSGFNQELFAETSSANTRTLSNLITEYHTVRKATLTLFKSFDDNALKQTGRVSDATLSVRAIAAIILGHENHHIKIIKARYL